MKITVSNRTLNIIKKDMLHATVSTSKFTPQYLPVSLRREAHDFEHHIVSVAVVTRVETHACEQGVAVAGGSESFVGAVRHQHSQARRVPSIAEQVHQRHTENTADDTK